jgi:hypothetical protein
MDHEMYFLAMRMRASRFRRYDKERKRWLRWGCYYSDQNWYGDLRWVRAYENTTAILESVGRIPQKNYLDLPENVAELFSLEGDVLRWKVAQGRAAAGSLARHKQVGIYGTYYSSSRIKEYLRTGPPSAYKKIIGTKTLREDTKWDVTFWLGGEQRTVMECHTEEEADQALWAVRWTVYHFQ